MRATRLGARARQSLAAERLHPYHGADLVAVDVDVADPNALADEGGRAFDAGVDAKRQAVAGGVDGFADLIKLIGGIAYDVQDRSEHFAFEVGHGVDFEHMRRKKHAIRMLGGKRQFAQQFGFAGHLRGMEPKGFARCFVDHRADVGGRVHRIADFQFVGRAEHHLQHFVGDVILQKQYAQGRAALAGTVEGTGDRIARDLLRQCGRIHDHGILAAGLGNHCGDRSIAGRQRTVDDSSGFGRAGEHHARQTRIRENHRADARAAAGQQMQHVARHTRLMQQLHRRSGNQRCRRRRFGENGIAGRQRPRDLAGENRQREIPWADAGEYALAVQREVVGLTSRSGHALGHELPTRFGSVIAQEIARLAQLSERGRQGLAAFAHQQRHERIAVLFE